MYRLSAFENETYQHLNINKEGVDNRVFWHHIHQ